jgi:hypothetical protein
MCFRRSFALTILSAALALRTSAQFRNGSQTVVLELPRISQRAEVVQRLGLTDIRVVYHRPAVHGRAIWGKVVPYGQVWRTGANEITRLELSDPVTVEGHPLPAGAYGLHMIPRETSWTVILSRNATSWGSFFYDEKDDALRFDVAPQPNEMRELLTFDFSDVAPDAATLRLEWEKVAIPIHIAVDNKALVLPRIRRQLTGLPQYTSMAWDDAARYLLDQGWNLEEALGYADRSLQKEQTFQNLLTKSELLAKLGKSDEARTTFDHAIRSADAVQVHLYARQLQAQGPEQAAQALQIYEANAAAHPDVWITHAGMARVHSAHHEFERAAAEMKLAASGAPDQQRAGVEKQLEQLKAGRDINVQ